MKMYTDKDILKLLQRHMEVEKGKPISDADRAYKRGWRDCIRSLRQHIKTTEPV
jgi:hypothetical protein